MSASREKKQRQGGTPTDKTLNAKQQAEQTRRKTIQYTVIGVVVAVLVAALLIWNSGFFQARATAVKVGGTKYSTAQASYFYHNSYSYNYMTNYAQYLGYNTGLPPEKQEYMDGKTYHDFFLESALSDMSTITALYDASLADKDKGVTAADVKDDLNANIESAKQQAKQYSMSYKQFLKARYGSYVTPSVFEDCLTRSLIATRYRQNYKDSLDYTTDQLNAYYEEHSGQLDTFQYSYLYFAPDAVETKDADGNDIEMSEDEKKAKEEENLAAAKAKAEDAKASLAKGESVDDVISSSTPSSSGKDEEAQGLKLNSLYSEWLTDKERKAGDVELIENASGNGFYVVVFHGRYLDDTPSVDTRHILIQAEMDDGAASPTEEQMAAAKAKAEELLEQWKAGAATEESFAELANTNSSDGGSNTNGGLYEKVYKGQFVTNYDAWLFDSARQPGDTGIVENQGNYFGYHVVYFVKQNPDYFSWMSQSKELLTDEDSTSWLEDLRDNCPAEAAGAAKYLGQ